MQAQSPIFKATVACANFPNCSSVHCSAVYQYNNYSGKLYFLPCENPPGVRFVLDYNSGAVHVDRLINRNTTMPFVIPGLTVDIIVPLIHQMDGSLLFAVWRLHAVDRCMCCTMLVWGVISVVTVRQNAEHTSFVLAEIATSQPLCVWLLHAWHAVYTCMLLWVWWVGSIVVFTGVCSNALLYLLPLVLYMQPSVLCTNNVCLLHIIMYVVLFFCIYI